MIWLIQRMFRLILTTKTIVMTFQKEVTHLSLLSVRRASHTRLMASCFKKELKPSLITRSKKSKKFRKSKAEKTNKKWTREIRWSSARNKLSLTNSFKSTTSVFHTREILTMLLPIIKTSSTTKDTPSRGTRKLIKKLWKSRMKLKSKRT